MFEICLSVTPKMMAQRRFRTFLISPNAEILEVMFLRFLGDALHMGLNENFERSCFRMFHGVICNETLKNYEYALFQKTNLQWSVTQIFSRYSKSESFLSAAIWRLSINKKTIVPLVLKRFGAFQW